MIFGAAILCSISISTYSKAHFYPKSVRTISSRSGKIVLYSVQSPIFAKQMGIFQKQIPGIFDSLDSFWKLEIWAKFW